MKLSAGRPMALCGWRRLPGGCRFGTGGLRGRVCGSVGLRGRCGPLAGTVSSRGLALGGAFLHGGGHALFHGGGRALLGSVGRLLVGPFPLLGGVGGVTVWLLPWLLGSSALGGI